MRNSALYAISALILLFLKPNETFLERNAKMMRLILQENCLIWLEKGPIRRSNAKMVYVEIRVYDSCFTVV